MSKIWAYMGASLVFLYLGRGSLLYFWSGPIRPLFLYGGQILLLISFFFVLIAKDVRRFSLAGIGFILLTLPGVVFSDFSLQVFAKWVGWVMLYALVGPVIQSHNARVFRQSAWRTIRIGFIFISTASFAWYVLGLPSYWPGTFIGVTSHSMLLGPIAGMAFLFCANYAFLKRSTLYAVLSLLAIIPCFLAGSRTAILALVAGMIVLVGLSFRRINLRKSLLVISITLITLSFGIALLQWENIANLDSAFTNTLEQKGLQNTREALWAARWKEFSENPLFGIGIGRGVGGEDEGVAIDASGNINVEPGSSYLALLSMTGIVGASGFFFIFLSSFRRIWLNRHSSFLPEMLIIGIFLTVHMVTEGWIYAVGSPFCLLFWLWLGHSRDLIEYPQELI